MSGPADRLDHTPPPSYEDTLAAFGAAAHEIKNALGPLTLTLQLTERQLLSSQPIPPADLAFARAQVRRLARLVDDLMDLTRLDLAQLEIRPRLLDLREIVREAVEVFRRGNPAPVQVAIPDAPIMVPADAARIEQVLFNFLENAVRYSDEGTAVEVGLTAALASPAVRVFVRDQGPGVPPEEQGRVFERFARGSAAEGKSGLGIGLYLCRTIIERHGGRIGVDSRPGAGASFWFELARPA